MELRESKKKKLRALFADHRWHDANELNRIAYRYGAYIWDFRHDEGMNIERKRVKGQLYAWRLKEDGE